MNMRFEIENRTSVSGSETGYEKHGGDCLHDGYVWGNVTDRRTDFFGRDDGCVRHNVLAKGN